MNQAKYANSVAVITGGGSGIGAALGHRLASLGACVVLADINLAGAEAVAEAIRRNASGPPNRAKATAVELDVTDAVAVAKVVAETVERFGRLDFMFNNAGVGVIGEARTTELDEWNRMFDVNVRGVIHGIYAAYPQMIEQGGGYIINTASFAGLVPFPFLAAYSGSKHAVVGLSLSLRAEAAAHGVKVSVVCPSLVQTPIVSDSPIRGIDREKMFAALPTSPISPDDCAREILKGIDKNRGIIPVTGAAKLGWKLFRLAPWALDLVHGQLLKQIARRQRR